MNYRKRLILEKSKKQKKGFFNGLWKFANSNFGIFLMSSIVVTGITNYVANNIQEKQEEIKSRREANRYYIELEFRVLRLKMIADTLVTMNKFNRVLHSLNLPDTGVFKVLKKEPPAYAILLKRQIDDVINGTGTYKPSDKIFKDQHLIAVLSWFSFNMKEHRQMDKEISAVYGLQGIPPFGVPVTNDSVIRSYIIKLFEFSTTAKEYVEERDYSGND